MKHYMCSEKHDPANGKYGDCLRTAVACLVERNPHFVPHFADGGVDGETVNQRLDEFLATLGFLPFWFYYEGSITLDEILDFQQEHNPKAHYLLFCKTSSGDHVVICKGGKVEHDPAWIKSPILGPGTVGFWGLMVVTKI